MVRFIWKCEASGNTSLPPLDWPQFCRYLQHLEKREAIVRLAIVMAEDSNAGNGKVGEVELEGTLDQLNTS